MLVLLNCFCITIIQQVVAGTLYKFNLVLDHSSDNPSSCEVPASSPETCQMEVYDIPWQNRRSVVWDQVDCAGQRQELRTMGHQAPGNEAISNAKSIGALIFPVVVNIIANFRGIMQNMPQSL